MAYGSNIYVYVPQFPKQTIAEEPVLIFTSQPSAPRLTGHLDLRHPHTINNLVVQFLGNEEVIATVRDDGDVDAFLVRHIVQAIERRAEAASELSVRGEEIRSFFQSNVGKSAWGLAIHAQARILATSANTHEVRVFKFGLLQSEDDEASGQSDGPDFEVHNAQGGSSQDRKTDVTYQILNGEANIPYISFCNTGDDPQGRWLLTTDVAGICQVMDLHDMKPVQKFRFGQSFVNPNLLEERFDRLNAGWIIMFLDRRSFQEEDDVGSALGLDEDESLPWTSREPAIWDISETIRHLPEYTEPFMYHRTKRRKVGRSSNENGVSSVENTNVVPAAQEEDAGDQSVTDDESSSDGGAPLDVEIEIETESPEHSDEETAEPTGGDSDSASASDSEEDDDEETALIDDAEDPEDEMTEDTIPFTAWYNGQSIKVNEPKFALNDATFWNELPCPVIHASVRNIYLLQPFINPSLLQAVQTPAKPWMPPMVGLANPLRQAIQQDFEYLRIFERLNMVVSIPPLGMVVLASQKGRAVVLSLTKSRTPKRESTPEKVSPRGAKQNKNSAQTAKTPAWMDKTHYTMRVECILPFAHQERANERPFAPLHGIAASPLQGCSDKVRGTGGRKDGGGKAERWRLMMMYQDHSILSYEIGRQSGSPGGKAVDVEELIV